MTKSIHERALEIAYETAEKNWGTLIESLGSVTDDDSAIEVSKKHLNLTIQSYLTSLAKRGWKLVPKAQTADMVLAFHEPDECDDPTCLRCRWIAAFDAAPSPEDVSE